MYEMPSELPARDAYASAVLAAVDIFYVRALFAENKTPKQNAETKLSRVVRFSFRRLFT